jgi:hypothetical protein
MSREITEKKSLPWRHSFVANARIECVKVSGKIYVHG